MLNASACGCFSPRRAPATDCRCQRPVGCTAYRLRGLSWRGCIARPELHFRVEFAFGSQQNAAVKDFFYRFVAAVEKPSFQPKSATRRAWNFLCRALARLRIANERIANDIAGKPMYRSRLTTQRLAAVFLLGCLLFNYPVLALFNKAAAVFGIPVLVAYVFLAWLGFIALIALIIERRQD